jgi:hypothetical protein
MHANLNQRFFAASWLAIGMVIPMMDDMTPIVPAAARVSCEIRATRNATGAKLDGVIKASGPVSGSFHFTVRKRGGEEVVSQSGDFTVEDASPTEIKKASIDLDPSEAYQASLKVKWPNGSSSCSGSMG